MRGAPSDLVTEGAGEGAVVGRDADGHCSRSAGPDPALASRQSERFSVSWREILADARSSPGIMLSCDSSTPSVNSTPAGSEWPWEPLQRQGGARMLRSHLNPTASPAAMPRLAEGYKALSAIMAALKLPGFSCRDNAQFE